MTALTIGIGVWTLLTLLIIYELYEKLDRVLTLVQTLAINESQRGVATMAVLDDLTAQVAKNTDTEAAAIQLIRNIATALANCGGDPTRLAALQKTLQTSADELAAAILENTPAEPPTP